MKIALLGYGKMGRMIERIAEERGHEVVLTVDEGNRGVCTDAQLKCADVAIEFTMPAVAVDNYKWCLDCGVPVVSGTTGWLERWEEVKAYAGERDGGFFYASNFSIGVNIFFRLNRYLARMMDGFKDYGVFIEETHHIHKLDAPSGTAITLAEEVVENLSAYHGWKLDDGGQPVREGECLSGRSGSGRSPGIHGVTYKSAVDEIEIRHSAFSREGFARGAVLAAEFMAGRKGVYGMDDLLSDKLSF